MSKQHAGEHPSLVIIRGLPGSGKTYLALQLQKSIGDKEVVMLDPDATDYDSKQYKDHTKTLTEEGVDPSLHAYRFLRAQAHAAIAAHKIIIWNQPFTNLEIFNKMIANLQAHASEHHTDLPVLVVEVNIDETTAKNRIAERKQAGGHGPSDNTFNKFVDDYHSFAEYGYNTVAVQGDGDLSKSVRTIKARLEQ